jgi:hypothetical protein
MDRYTRQSLAQAGTDGRDVTRIKTDFENTRIRGRHGLNFSKPLIINTDNR